MISAGAAQANTHVHIYSSAEILQPHSWIDLTFFLFFSFSTMTTK